MDWHRAGKWLYHVANGAVVLFVLIAVVTSATGENLRAMLVLSAFGLVAWFSAQGAIISLANIYDAVPEALGFAKPVAPQSRRAVLAYMFASYLGTIVVFAAAYYQIGTGDTAAFKEPISEVIDAVYFSVVTAATVGYGDIRPVDTWARILVIAQIFLSLIYTIFFFSVAASFMREPPARRDPPLR